MITPSPGSNHRDKIKSFISTSTSKKEKEKKSKIGSSIQSEKSIIKENSGRSSSINSRKTCNSISPGVNNLNKLLKKQTQDQIKSKISNTKKITIQLFHPDMNDRANNRDLGVKKDNQPNLEQSSEKGKILHKENFNMENNPQKFQKEQYFSNSSTNFNYNSVNSNNSNLNSHQFKTSSSFDNHEIITNRFASANVKEKDDLNKFSISEKSDKDSEPSMKFISTAAGSNTCPSVYTQINKNISSEVGNSENNSPCHFDKNKSLSKEKLKKSNNSHNTITNSSTINKVNHKTHKIELNVNDNSNNNHINNSIKYYSNKIKHPGIIKTTSTVSTFSTVAVSHNSNIAHNLLPNKFHNVDPTINNNCSVINQQHRNGKKSKNNMNKYHLNNLDNNAVIHHATNSEREKATHQSKMNLNKMKNNQTGKTTFIEPYQNSNNILCSSSPNKLINKNYINSSQTLNDHPKKTQNENNKNLANNNKTKITSLDQVNMMDKKSNQKSEIVSLPVSPELKLKQYGALFQLINTNLKEIKDLINSSDYNQDNEINYMYNNHKNKNEKTNSEKNVLNNLPNEKRIEAVRPQYNDDYDKIINECDVENSQERILRLIENNNLINSKFSNFQKSSKNKMLMSKGKGKYSLFENLNYKNNKNFFDEEFRKNENSLLFSSFNSEFYQNLVENLNMNSLDGEIIDTYHNYSFDFTSMNNLNIMNTHFRNKFNLSNANISTIHNLTKMNNMADINYNRDQQVQNNKSDLNTKTDQTQCQYDDIYFTNNQNNKNYKLQMLKEKDNLNVIENAVVDSGNMLIDLDSTLKLNSTLIDKDDNETPSIYNIRDAQEDTNKFTINELRNIVSPHKHITDRSIRKTNKKVSNSNLNPEELNIKVSNKKLNKENGKANCKIY